MRWDVSLWFEALVFVVFSSFFQNMTVVVDFFVCVSEVLMDSLLS